MSNLFVRFTYQQFNTTMTNTANQISQKVTEAITCFRNSSVLETFENLDAKHDAAWHHAYSEECRLFGLFMHFTEQEAVEYRAIVEWLNDTGLTLSDLTTAELIEIFLQKNSK